MYLKCISKLNFGL